VKDARERAIEELANYARAQGLSQADELLVELMASVLASRAGPSHEERLASEDRALDALRDLLPPEPE
jgi:hypothetical protein